MPEVIFNGAAGRIEGRLYQQSDPTAPVALILHPHPEHGGTMNNKVTYSMFRVFALNGFTVLRFNFRGVGKSEGNFGKGEGELCDAASAYDWLQSQFPNAERFWVGGFSFGAWIGMQLLMRRPEIEAFVMASPPANKYDFSFLAPCPTSGLVIQSKQDDIVSEPDVQRLVRKLRVFKAITVDYETLDATDHFFEGARDNFETKIAHYIQNYPTTKK